MNDLNLVLEQLRRPFHPSHITWKPGAVKGDRALALAYADLRAYMNRLDEVCGSDWAVAYEPWGQDRLICRLTIAGVTRSSTGETTNESERSEIGGTVAEAQAFKRACAMFGLGRYLYTLPSGWEDYDPAKKQFTDKAKARLTGLLVQHYRRATEGKEEVADIYAADKQQDNSKTTSEHESTLRATEEQLEALDAIGLEYYGAAKWPTSTAKWLLWASGNRTSDARELTRQEIETAITTLRNRMNGKVHAEGSR